jgi:predicted RecA/RadA family phage recombinase
MTTTRAVLTPYEAEFPVNSFPQLLVVLSRPVLAFDATTSETAYWTLVVPSGYTSPMTAVITYMMASAITGGVAFDVAVEAVTDGDALDLDAGTSFDTVNTGTQATVPGTVGYIDQITITLTNGDSAAVGDYYRISVARAVANAADTATGDLYLLLVALQDAA